MHFLKVFLPEIFFFFFFLLRVVECGFYARSRSGGRTQRGRVRGVLGKVTGYTVPAADIVTPHCLPFHTSRNSSPSFSLLHLGAGHPGKDPVRHDPGAPGARINWCPQELPGETTQANVSLKFSAPCFLVGAQHPE